LAIFLTRMLKVMKPNVNILLMLDRGRQRYIKNITALYVIALTYSQSVNLRSDNDSNIPRAVINKSDNCSNIPKAII
jgi:hypothetical protein